MASNRRHQFRQAEVSQAEGDPIDKLSKSFDGYRRVVRKGNYLPKLERMQAAGQDPAVHVSNQLSVLFLSAGGAIDSIADHPDPNRVLSVIGQAMFDLQKVTSNLDQVRQDTGLRRVK